MSRHIVAVQLYNVNLSPLEAQHTSLTEWRTSLNLALYTQPTTLQQSRSLSQTKGSGRKAVSFSTTSTAPAVYTTSEHKDHLLEMRKSAHTSLFQCMCRHHSLFKMARFVSTAGTRKAIEVTVWYSWSVKLTHKDGAGGVVLVQISSWHSHYHKFFTVLSL